MRSLSIIDVIVLLLIGLFFNIIIPFGRLAPDFLLAAFAVIIIPKHHWKLELISGVILLGFTVVHCDFSFFPVLRVVITGIVIYLLIYVFRNYIHHQGIWTGIICLLGGLLGGWISSVLSRVYSNDFIFWALLTSGVAYTFHVTLEFGERIFATQYRKSQ